MTELARGSVADRPWGMTLAALGMRGLTGQLDLSDGKARYVVAFHSGAVVAAYSPLASDAAVRIAMTSGLLSSTQVADVARRQQANPSVDEVDLIAQLIRLGPDQATKLRRRAIAQRAARTFSVERGDFVVDDQITMAIHPGSELDIRTVVFLGARNLAEQRLASDLAMFGSWFRLLPDAMPDLPQFGFARSEDPVIDLLEAGAELADLERMGQDPHVVRAMIYALSSCSAVESNGQVAPARASQPPQRPTPQPERLTPPPMRPTPEPQRQSQPIPQARQSQPIPQARQSQPAQATPPQPTPVVARTKSQQSTSQYVPPQPTPVVARTQSQQRTSQYAPLDRHGFDPATTRRAEPIVDAATARAPGRSGPARQPRQTAAAQAQEVHALIAKHLDLLKKRADHFALLGTHPNASVDEIRKAYFALARHLHPDRLTALGIADDTKDAQRLFAEVNTAFGVLSDTKSRTEYISILKRGGTAAVAEEQKRAEEMATRIVEGEEAFHRGQTALRRDDFAVAIAELKRAMELSPEEVDYIATHAWAVFCASPDKVQIASSTRQTLERAINKSPRAVVPRFLAGRVERMLGRDNDALRHFQEVLNLSPHHQEAATEARMIEQRLGGSRRR